jgi:MFS family permease
MTLEGFSTMVTGLIQACYFFGLFCGYFLYYPLIRQVGHIRAFAAFAGLGTTLVLLHSLHISPIFWAILRFLTGLIVFGLFTVIESWLNACTEESYRGRTLSIYMILNYIALVIGQQMLNLGNVRGQLLFILAALLISLSLVPVTLSTSAHPVIPKFNRRKLQTFFQHAPIGMLGAFVAGLLNSAFFSLMPMVGLKIGLTVFQISRLMSTTILAGLAIQWLMGVLSDRYDRSLILLNIGILLALISGMIAINPDNSYSQLLIKMACLGGLLFTIYPVSVARTYDRFRPDEAVAVSAALIFCYGIGAIGGPLLASLLITILKTPFGIFYHWSMVCSLFSAAIFYLRLKKQPATRSGFGQVEIPGRVEPRPLTVEIGGRLKTEAHFSPECQKSELPITGPGSYAEVGTHGKLH